MFTERSQTIHAEWQNIMGCRFTLFLFTMKNFWRLSAPGTMFGQVFITAIDYNNNSDNNDHNAESTSPHVRCVGHHGVIFGISFDKSGKNAVNTPSDPIFAITSLISLLRRKAGDVLRRPHCQGMGHWSSGISVIINNNININRDENRSSDGHTHPTHCKVRSIGCFTDFWSLRLSCILFYKRREFLQMYDRDLLDGLSHIIHP